ncbi:MAG: V-type ATP synthase subunit E [Sphaerochaetaceae bacterium]|jgi:V/A-type H+-transporting ATPase subunit E
MELQIQDLVNSIKKDGIAEAEKLAAEILADADQKKKKMLDEAKKEASLLINEAKKEVAIIEQSGKAAIQQAARDVSLSLKEEISSQLGRLLEEGVVKAVTTKELVSLIVQVVKTNVIAPQDADLLLDSDDAKKLGDALKSELAEELKKGLEIKPVKMADVGFKLSSKKDGSYFDFSAQEITKLLAPFLSGTINEILKTK